MIHVVATVTLFDDGARLGSSRAVDGSWSAPSFAEASAWAWWSLLVAMPEAATLRIAVVDRREGVLAMSNGCGRLLTAARPSWAGPEQGAR